MRYGAHDACTVLYRVAGNVFGVMRRWMRVLVLVSVLGLFASAASAQTFTVDVDVQNQTVVPENGETAEFHISITNEGSADRQFTASYTVSNPGWYFLPDYQVQVPAGETRTTVLYATPGKEAVAGSKAVIIRVKDPDGATVERTAFYTIDREIGVGVTGLSTDNTRYRPGETVNVAATVKNFRNAQLARGAYELVFDLDGETETAVVPGLRPGEEAELEAAFQLDRFDKGAMTMTARTQTIDGVRQDVRRATIRVAEVENVQVSGSDGGNMLAQEHTLTAKNAGNVKALDTEVEADVPSYMELFVAFSQKPDSSTAAQGITTYTWNLGDLEPGEEAQVSYTVNYWVPLLIAIILLAAGFVAFRAWRSPHIVKRVYRKEGRHSVHLRIENRSSRELSGVVVRDYVPSIASLIEKFDASPPQTIREGEEGTELEWRVGTMEPGEERILTYTLTPNVQVEDDVTLPSAHMQYEQRGSETKTHSHPVQADFR